MGKTIIVEIDQKDGGVTIDIQGGVDSSCAGISDAFKKMGHVTKDIKKPEFYKTPNANKVTTGK